MIPGAVDWTDDVHTRRLFYFHELCIHGCSSFLREGDFDTWLWLMGRLILVGSIR